MTCTIAGARAPSPKVDRLQLKIAPAERLSTKKQQSSQLMGVH
jgi:hypothetical protein